MTPKPPKKTGPLACNEKLRLAKLIDSDISGSAIADAPIRPNLTPARMERMLTRLFYTTITHGNTPKQRAHITLLKQILETILEVQALKQRIIEKRQLEYLESRLNQVEAETE